MPNILKQTIKRVRTFQQLCFDHSALSQSESESVVIMRPVWCRKVREPGRNRPAAPNGSRLALSAACNSTQSCCDGGVETSWRCLEAATTTDALHPQSLHVERRRRAQEELGRPRLAKKITKRVSIYTCKQVQMLCNKHAEAAALQPGIAHAGGGRERHLLEGAQLPAPPKIKNKHQNNKKDVF